MPATATLRARDRGPAATRRAILAAAETLLARGGEAGLSIRELCGRASGTPPPAYPHLGAKGAPPDPPPDRGFLEIPRAPPRPRPPAATLAARCAGAPRAPDCAG